MKRNRIRMLEPDMPVQSTGIFKGEASGFLNWNDIPYSKFYMVYKQLLANFWVPDEVSMLSDIKDFKEMEPEVQEAFLKIITVISGMDSLQTPAVLEFLRFPKDPAVKAIMANIAQQESIHNQSYSYVLSSLIPLEEQKALFSEMKNHEMVLKRNMPIVNAYEKFIEEDTPQSMFEGLVHSTILEGLFFYCAFAFFYNLARNNKMLGTSTMINYIHRDEMVHFAFIADLVSILMAEYPELNTEENAEYIRNAFRDAVQVEKEWSEFILGDIEFVIDLDLDEFNDYVEYMANKRVRLFGLENIFVERENPMPWIQTYDDSSINNTKSDFFESKPRSYAKTSETNGFDEL